MPSKMHLEVPDGMIFWPKMVDFMDRNWGSQLALVPDDPTRISPWFRPWVKKSCVLVFPIFLTDYFRNEFWKLLDAV